MGIIINFLPIQEGTGDPSPDNVRPIKPGLTIDGIGDIYGGYLDVENKEVVEEWISVSYDGTTDAIRTQSSYQRFAMLADADGRLLYERTVPSHIVCDKLLNVGANGMGNPTYRIAVVSAYQIQVKITEAVNTPELLLDWLDDNPIHVVIELATAVHHTLTDAQLTQAYNQLTKISPVMLDRRRRILLESPHLETAQGTVASFKTDLKSALKECKIYFSPIQSGTGDPSPSNVRPISGWDGVTIYQSCSDINNPTSLTIPFPQTIYGGYVDLVKGEVWANWHNAKGSDLSWSKSIGNYSSFVSPTSPLAKAQDNNLEVLIISSCYTSASWNSAGATIKDKYLWIYSGGRIRLKDTGKEDMTVEEFVATISNEDFCYKIPPTLVTTLTPTQLKALKGQNNLWSNANGNIEVKFWTH